MSQRSMQLASEYAEAQSEEQEEREIIRQMESDFEYGWYDDDFGSFGDDPAPTGVSFEAKFMASSYL